MIKSVEGGGYNIPFPSNSSLMAQKSGNEDSRVVERRNTPVPETTPVSRQSDTEASAEEVTAAVDKINLNLMSKSTNVVFEFDKKGDPPVVKVVDRHNGEVIREIPSKEMRAVAKALNELADNMTGSSGILLDEQL